MNNEPQKMTYEQAQTLNRRERRRLGKINGVKIVGSNVPVREPKK